MPLINREYFADNFPIALKNRQALVAMPVWAFGQASIDAYGKCAAKPDRESALNLLDTIGDHIKRGGQQGKAGRPWDFLPDIFSTLDRTKPWWGWEFETGWRTKNDLLKAVGHVWDTFDGCMFDGEGEGAWQVEITFMPEEMDKFLDGTATTCKFMQWVDANQHMVYKSGANDVGTHLNISDPRMDRYNFQELAKFLNRTLWFTQKTNGHRKDLFGRESVYAGFFANSSNNYKNVWLEFKGFRTTYSYEKFQQYIKTSQGLQKVVDMFFGLPANHREGRQCVSNLYEIVFQGAEPVVESLDNLVVPAGAKTMYTRRVGTFGAM